MTDAATAVTPTATAIVTAAPEHEHDDEPTFGAWRMVAGEYDDEETVEVYVGDRNGAAVRSMDLTVQRAQGYPVRGGEAWHYYSSDMVAVRPVCVPLYLDVRALVAHADHI